MIHAKKVPNCKAEHKVESCIAFLSAEMYASHFIPSVRNSGGLRQLP